MKVLKGLAVAAALAIAGQASAVTISANLGTPTLIGSFGPGTYNFTSTGVANLTGQPGFEIDANGIPLPGSVTDPNYLYFNPNGSYQADGSFGPAGSTVKIGALAGTFSADGSSGYFQLGSYSKLTFATTTSVYGLVNDTYSPNNTGGFDVSVAAVPEPASWAMMIGGIGMAGGALRRRQKVRVSFAA